jgi:hypothetical protein
LKKILNPIIKIRLLEALATDPNFFSFGLGQTSSNMDSVVDSYSIPNEIVVLKYR